MNVDNNYLFYAFTVSVRQTGYTITMSRQLPDKEKFIRHINDHYNELKCKYRTFCHQNGYKFDEDIFSDTILKCYEAIARRGKLDDTTPQGMENFFFKSFVTNVKREGQYARVAKRDLNVDSDSINDLYEAWYNTNKSSSSKKVYNDLWTDFSTLYIMRTVEDNFPSEDSYLFKLKTLCNMTYKEVQEKTQAKKVRQRICAIKQWLVENVKKDDVKEVFHQLYGDLNPE